MRRASIQLSTNFLVVLIICLLLLGIGIRLITMFVSSSEKMKYEVDEYHKRELEKIMLSEGGVVATYPTTVTVHRGDHVDFALAISNEKGFDNNFSMKVEHANPIAMNDKKLYVKGPYFIKNNEQYFTTIRIIIDKDASSGTHIFNLYVYNTTKYNASGAVDYPAIGLDIYGDIQKLHVNVK